MGKQTDELVQMLISSLGETLGVLAHLSDAELDDLSEHPCAMGGTERDLLRVGGDGGCLLGGCRTGHQREGKSGEEAAFHDGR